MTALQRAIQKQVPVTEITPKSKRWWTKELTQLRKQANKLGRQSYTSAKINFSYAILFHLTTSYSSYFGGKKGISRNKTSFFLLMQAEKQSNTCNTCGAQRSGKKVQENAEIYQTAALARLAQKGRRPRNMDHTPAHHGSSI